MHAFRTTSHVRTLAALGLVAAALLATTACEPSTDDAGATPSPDSAGPSPTWPSVSPSAVPSSSAPSSPAPSSSSPGRPGEAEGDPSGIDGNCPDDYTEVTVDWAVSPTKDDSKLLLTVTNTSDKPCMLRTYPVLRLDDGNGRLVAVFESSKPQAEVTLAPGKEAYAGLLLRQSNKDVSSRVNDMALAPHGQSPDSNTGEGVLLEMPKGGVYADNMVRVTYWNSSSEAAVTPLFPH